MSGLGIRFQHKREYRTISLAEFFLNPWFGKSCIRPCGKHIRNTSTGSLPHIDEAEHLHDKTVARIGHSTEAHLLNTCPNIARILKHQSVRGTSNHYSAHAIIIGVEQTVGQRFTNRLVHRGIINTKNAFKLERSLQRLSKLKVHPEKEIKQIA